MKMLKFRYKDYSISKQTMYEFYCIREFDRIDALEWFLEINKNFTGYVIVNNMKISYTNGLIHKDGEPAIRDYTIRLYVRHGIVQDDIRNHIVGYRYMIDGMYFDILWLKDISEFVNSMKYMDKPVIITSDTKYYRFTTKLYSEDVIRWYLHGREWFADEAEILMFDFEMRLKNEYRIARL